MEREPSVVWANERLLPKMQQKLGDYGQLVKFRLTVMVLCSGLVGFWLASGASPDWSRMAWFALGTFLIIGGANAFNQVAERSNDRLMQRTASRPLPAGRMRVARSRHRGYDDVGRRVGRSSIPDVSAVGRSGRHRHGGLLAGLYTPEAT